MSAAQADEADADSMRSKTHGGSFRNFRQEVLITPIIFSLVLNDPLMNRQAHKAARLQVCPDVGVSYTRRLNRDLDFSETVSFSDKQAKRVHACVLAV